MATGLAVAVNALMMKPTVAFASASTPTPVPKGQTGIATIDFGIGQLLSLFFGAISVVGLFVLGKGIIDFAGALPDRDTGSMKQAALEFLSGLLMASIGASIACLGLKI